MEDLRLSDQAIAQIARCLQLALLSGTDVVDHLRLLRFAEGTSRDLVPTADYVKVFEENLAKMQTELDKWMEEDESTTTEA